MVKLIFFDGRKNIIFDIYYTLYQVVLRILGAISLSRETLTTGIDAGVYCVLITWHSRNLWLSLAATWPRTSYRCYRPSDPNLDHRQFTEQNQRSMHFHFHCHSRLYRFSTNKFAITNNLRYNYETNTNKSTNIVSIFRVRYFRRRRIWISNSQWK